MANTWNYDGVDLSSFGVITLFDDFLDIPDKRGENITIPFADGKKFVEKYYDHRIFMVGMTIVAADADALEVTMNSLRALLSSRTQKVLSRTLTDESVQNVLASVEKKLQVNRPVPYVAKLVIEFELSTPFFSGDVFYEDNATIDTNPTLFTVNNAGTAPENSPVIILAGPLENTVITNTTNGHTLSYAGVIAGGDSVEIRKINGQWTAILNGVTNVISDVSHSGSADFMVFEPGDNELSIADDEATTGSFSFGFYPPHF